MRERSEDQRQEMSFPTMYEVRQDFSAPILTDLEAELQRELGGLSLERLVAPGQTVAVAVGSRGIHQLVPLVAALIKFLKGLGLNPHIIPAMGSHGGATADGQKAVLEGLGITQSAVGAPTVSNMEVVSLGELDSGMTVLCARDALEADHLVVVNRVKPHTAFRGEVESGLCKMLAVGLGRKEGASLLHRFGLGASIVPAARRILQRAPVLLGLAILESPKGGIAKLRAVMPEDFPAADKELLHEAWKIFPRIPVDDLDVLVVDRMGKDISGAGMDPNVIGLWRREGGPRIPDYRTVVVLDLTSASHGNATGIGMADLTTKALMEKVDLGATYTNALTSGVFRSARLPIPMENDMEALKAAMAHVADPAALRMARISDTLHLERFWVTQPVLKELEDQEGITVDPKPMVLRFDPSGRLKPMEGGP